MPRTKPQICKVTESVAILSDRRKEEGRSRVVLEFVGVYTLYAAQFLTLVGVGYTVQQYFPHHSVTFLFLYFFETMVSYHGLYLTILVSTT